jgi:hypothetical protein
MNKKERKKNYSQTSWLEKLDESFDHANKENRWCTFLASDSALAVEFRDEFERAKAINLELRIDLSSRQVRCCR